MSSTDYALNADSARVAALFIGYVVSLTAYSRKGRPAVDAVDYLTLQQALLSYSLMSATIPCLKGFLGRFQTGDLARLTESELMCSRGSRFGTETNSRSHRLSTMDRQRVGKAERTQDELTVSLRPDVLQDSRVYAQTGGDNGSIRSYGSDQMIIHRRVDIDVDVATPRDEHC